MSSSSAAVSSVIITDQPIDLNTCWIGVSGPEHGAQLTFTGAVRAQNHGRAVVAVSYDAFAPLCESVLHEIWDEARARWGSSLCLRLVHRIGRLVVGELSVAIVVASPHRDEGYQASRYMIEQLKKRAPIWKKETYTDGESEWLEGHALCQVEGHL